MQGTFVKLILLRLALLCCALLTGCTIVSANRVFPKLSWYWSADAKAQRAERRAEQTIKPLEQRQNACRVELWAALQKRRTTEVVDLEAVGKQLVASYGVSVVSNALLNEWAASQQTDWQTKVCDVVWLQTQVPYVQDMSWLLCYHKQWDGSK